MRVVSFNHGLTTCWNHGNAHFLRGVLRELVARGHAAASFEPSDGWSRQNLQSRERIDSLACFERDFPDLRGVARWIEDDVAAMLDGADLVLVHEWTDPALVAQIGAARAHGGRFTLLFHDTHHRAVSDSEAIGALDLSGYDGVLAFGESLAERYRHFGWGSRVFVWHEAADTRLFHPPTEDGMRAGVVWIGNWGDGERDEELRAYMLDPVRDCDAKLTTYGVRYPNATLSLLRLVGAEHRGWLPNASVPRVFARHLCTIHVPRRAYTYALPGIPTIRPFEALACGVPLLSAPWRDREGLFRDTDYLLSRSPSELGRNLRAVLADSDLRRELARSGLETIRTRHTCAHRVDELMSIVSTIGGVRMVEPV